MFIRLIDFEYPPKYANCQGNSGEKTENILNTGLLSSSSINETFTFKFKNLVSVDFMVLSEILSSSFSFFWMYFFVRSFSIKYNYFPFYCSSVITVHMFYVKQQYVCCRRCCLRSHCVLFVIKLILYFKTYHPEFPFF